MGRHFFVEPPNCYATFTYGGKEFCTETHHGATNPLLVFFFFTQHFTMEFTVQNHLFGPKKQEIFALKLSGKNTTKTVACFFFVFNFCLTGDRQAKILKETFFVLQLSKRVGTVSVPFLRKWPNHKCELGYEGKPIEIEFAVMQRKSREETCFLLEGHFKG